MDACNPSTQGAGKQGVQSKKLLSLLIWIQVCWYTAVIQCSGSKGRWLIGRPASLGKSENVGSMRDPVSKIKLDGLARWCVPLIFNYNMAGNQAT